MDSTGPGRTSSIRLDRAEWRALSVGTATLPAGFGSPWVGCHSDRDDVTFSVSGDIWMSAVVGERLETVEPSPVVPRSESARGRLERGPSCAGRTPRENSRIPESPAAREIPKPHGSRFRDQPLPAAYTSRGCCTGFRIRPVEDWSNSKQVETGRDIRPTSF